MAFLNFSNNNSLYKKADLHITYVLKLYYSKDEIGRFILRKPVRIIRL